MRAASCWALVEVFVPEIRDQDPSLLSSVSLRIDEPESEANFVEDLIDRKRERLPDARSAVRVVEDRRPGDQRGFRLVLDLKEFGFRENGNKESASHFESRFGQCKQRSRDLSRLRLFECRDATGFQADSSNLIAKPVGNFFAQSEPISKNPRE